MPTKKTRIRMTKTTMKKNAAETAADLFKGRSIHSVSWSPITTIDTTRKRHFIRFIGFDKLIQSEAVPTHLNGGVLVVEQMCTVYGEWWAYIQTDKPIETYKVTQMLQKEYSFSEGEFFTDVFPWARKDIKRYDYTRLQHFKLMMQMMRDIWKDV